MSFNSNNHTNGSNNNNNNNINANNANNLNNNNNNNINNNNANSVQQQPNSGLLGSQPGQQQPQQQQQQIPQGFGANLPPNVLHQLFQQQQQQQQQQQPHQMHNPAAMRINSGGAGANNINNNNIVQSSPSPHQQQQSGIHSPVTGNANANINANVNAPGPGIPGVSGVTSGNNINAMNSNNNNNININNNNSIQQQQLKQTIQKYLQNPQQAANLPPHILQQLQQHHLQQQQQQQQHQHQQNQQSQPQQQNQPGQVPHSPMQPFNANVNPNVNNNAMSSPQVANSQQHPQQGMQQFPPPGSAGHNQLPQQQQQQRQQFPQHPSQFQQQVQAQMQRQQQAQAQAQAQAQQISGHGSPQPQQIPTHLRQRSSISSNKVQMINPSLANQAAFTNASSASKPGTPLTSQSIAGVGNGVGVGNPMMLNHAMKRNSVANGAFIPKPGMPGVVPGPGQGPAGQGPAGQGGAVPGGPAAPVPFGSGVAPPGSAKIPDTPMYPPNLIPIPPFYWSEKIKKENERLDKEEKESLNGEHKDNSKNNEQAKKKRKVASTDLLLYEQIAYRDALNMKLFTKEKLQPSSVELMNKLGHSIKYYSDIKMKRMNSIRLALESKVTTNTKNIWGDGYQGYGNGFTNGPTKIIYPKERKKPTRFNDLYFSRSDLLQQSISKEDLVPIRLEFDVEKDKFRLRDTFTWNKNESLITLEYFVAQTMSDYRFSNPMFTDTVLANIKEQINEYRAFPAPDLDSMANNAPTATNSNSDSNNNGNVINETNLNNHDVRVLIKLDVTISNHRLVDQFEWDLLSKENNPEEFAEVMGAELQLPGEFVTAIAHSIREQLQLYYKALYLIGYGFDGTPIGEDEIKQHLLPEVNNSTWLRANDQNLDLEFGGTNAAGSAGGNTSNSNTNSLNLNGSSNSGSGSGGGNGPILLSNNNSNSLSKLAPFTPVVYELNYFDLEKLDKDRERELRRKRRNNGRSFNRRGIPNLPELSDVPKTFRTPVPSTVLPGGVDLGPSVAGFDDYVEEVKEPFVKLIDPQKAVEQNSLDTDGAADGVLGGDGADGLAGTGNVNADLINQSQQQHAFTGVAGVGSVGNIGNNKVRYIHEPGEKLLIIIKM